MTFDAVALCRDQPVPAVMLSAMLAAGEQLRVDTEDATKLIRLHHPDDGRLLLTTEGARLVQVPGEARRLLGIESADVPHPIWWVETRAPQGDPEAEAAVRRFTHALTTALGGVAWSSR
jgi:hypothetical protein